MDEPALGRLAAYVAREACWQLCCQAGTLTGETVMPNTSSKKSPKLCCWLALLVSAAVLFPASAASQDDLEAADKRIFQEIREHNQIMKNLEYLSDHIGPR